MLSIQDRPHPQLFMIRNTSVILKWMPLPLEEHCNDIVVTFPPVIFGANVEFGETSIPGFPIVSISLTIDFLCSLYYVYYYSTHLKQSIRLMVYSLSPHIVFK